MLSDSTINGFALGPSDASTPQHGVAVRRKSSNHIQSSSPYSNLDSRNSSKKGLGDLFHGDNSDTCRNSLDFSSASFDLSTSSLYDWRNFKDNYAQLLLTNLISDSCVRETEEDEGENLSKVDEENENLRDLFRESACRLFHDIADALDCSDIAQTEIDELWRRYEDFSKTTGIYAANVPNFSDEIDSRLKSIRFQLNFLMETTSGKRSRNSCSTDDNGCATLQQLRKWLHVITDKMDSVNEQKIDCSNVNDLVKILTDQQALHVEIQRDGGALLAAAKKQVSPVVQQQQQQSGVGGGSVTSATVSNNCEAQIASPVVNAEDKKARLVVESLERRWHCLWIKSLERQCVLEALIKQIELGIIGEDNESQCFEPAKKRQRLDEFCEDSIDDDDQVEDQKYANSNSASAAADCCSIASDTIPFSESEYESIMDGCGAVDANGNFYSPVERESEYCSEENDDTTTSFTNYEFAGLTDMTTSIYIENNDHKLNMNCESLLGQDVGYASENSMQMSSNDESLFDGGVGIAYDKVELVTVDLLNTNDYELTVGKSPSAPSLQEKTEKMAPAWSTNSSPSLERRNRIHNSPIKDYYKMMPDPADIDSDVAEKQQKVNNGGVPDDVRFIYTTKIAPPPVDKCSNPSATEMTDSLVVNVSQSTENLNAYHEIVTMLDDSLEHDDNEGYESTNQFNKKVGLLFPRGTDWIQLKGGSRQKLTVAGNSAAEIVDDESCDASSELSVDDINGNITPCAADAAISIAAVGQGSLKRRWRRTTTAITAVSLAEFISASASENAITNLATGNTSSFSSSMIKQRQQRKKLKARRIPRSVSDSEHLSVLALCQRRPPTTMLRWSNPRVDAAPPCTPRGSSASCCAEDTEEDGLEEEFNGAGEVMADNEDLDVEERMAGDGGSSVSADQTDWLWDDYKPPRHCEVGPLDNRLDDSTLTAFGDDYRLCLGSAPTSARSDISEPPFAYSPRNQRLPPVGFACQDSESEYDEKVSRFISDSQRRLQTAKQTLSKRMNLNEVGNQCVKEIRLLERFVRKREAYVAADLLKNWQNLYRETQSKQQDRDEIVKKMIHHLGQSLKEFMDQLSYYHTSMPRVTPSSSYEDLVREISALKASSQKITDGRQHLNALLRESSFVDCPELKICTTEYDVAAEKCSVQLKLMEDFFQNLMDFKNIEKVYKRILDGLIEKSKHLRHLNLPVDSSCHVLPDVTTIYGDIESCEDRLNRLETVCNHLCSSLSPDLTSYEHFSDDLREQLNAYRGQFEALKTQLADELPLLSQENRRRHRQTRSITKRVGAESKTHQNVNQTDSIDERIPSKKLSLKSIQRVLRYSWPVQLCLLLAVCLGVYFMQADCCSDVNYWNWAFGPRLDYVRGPPPS